VDTTARLNGAGGLVGTTVNSQFSSDIFRASAGYSFVRDAQKEFGATLGLHATDFKMTIAAAGITGCSAVSASARPTATSTTT